MGAAQSQPQEEEEETPAPAPAATPRPESPVPPLAEHPTAYLIGDGASCMTRDRGEILALHGQGRCFGRVRGVGGAEAQRHWAELVLSPEETLYLTERNLLTVYDDQREVSYEELRQRYEGDEAFARLSLVYEFYRNKGWVVKPGFQFGADYILYRGPPDEFHAEHAVVVLDAEQPTQWWIAKTVARLAADVRKHLVLARVDGSDIFELVVDDAFARPADALAGRRRAPVQKGAKAHSKKRKRKESGQGMAPPDTPVEGASP